MLHKLSLHIAFLILAFLLAIGVVHTAGATTPASVTSLTTIKKVTPRLQAQLHTRGMALGEPVFIRIFKKSRELEVWIQKRQRFTLFKTYIICDYSGDLGPKLAEGDRQSPEGFYQIGDNQMNPWSKYHLSFNLGYPNSYDRNHQRTGKDLMIHGGCSSDGCFAMSDFHMEQIYTITDAALSGGQMLFDVHIFPFRMTAKNLALHRDSPWFPFWMNLKQGYDLFEEFHIPPWVGVKGKEYVFISPAFLYNRTGSVLPRALDSR